MRERISATAPAKYNPARRRTPWWWHWGAIWQDGYRFGTWDEASKRCGRAKKGQQTALRPARKTGTKKRKDEPW